jgi:hypothetical protein
MNDNILRILSISSAISVLFPLCLGFIKFKSKPKYLRILGFLVLLSALTDLIALLFHQSISIAGNVYNILQFILLCLIFSNHFINIKTRNLLIVLFILFLVFAFINLFFIEGFSMRNTNLRTVSSISFIILSIYYFKYLLIEQPVDNILEFPMFWVNSAILIYFSGNIFLYAANNFISSQKIYLYYYLIHDMLNIVKNIFFGIAFISHLINLKQIVR